MTVNEDGSITIVVPEDATLGEHTFEVTVTYPDGSSSTVEYTYTVGTASQASEFNPVIDVEGDVQVKQGESVTLPAPVNADGTALPDGTKVSIEDANSWGTVNADGSVTIEVPADAALGEHSVELLLTYPDGSVDVMVIGFEVIADTVTGGTTSNPVLANTGADVGALAMLAGLASVAGGVLMGRKRLFRK